MAVYRKLHVSFWEDPEILDSFTPEERYLYLYLITNPHTRLCGIYQLSIRYVEIETGLPRKKIVALMASLGRRNKVRYNVETNEVAIRSWPKWNHSDSSKVQKGIDDELSAVKDRVLKEYVYSGKAVSIEYPYSIDTVSVPEDRVSIPDRNLEDTDTDTETDIMAAGGIADESADVVRPDGSDEPAAEPPAEENLPAPVSASPKPAPKEPAVTADRRPVYDWLKAGFEGAQKTTSGRFVDYGRECAAIKRLVGIAYTVAPDSPQEWLEAVVREFRKLRKGRDRFWTEQPFLPSVLSGGGILPRVLESLNGRSGGDLGNVARIEEALRANG